MCVLLISLDYPPKTIYNSTNQKIQPEVQNNGRKNHNIHIWTKDLHSPHIEHTLYNDEKALYFSLFKTFYEEDMIITFLKYCREKMQNSTELL